jgi:predicted  nucleic acid-binding Zn-ribbon protein
MSDAPLTLAVLAKFHQDVFLPDVQRIVGEAVASLELRMDAKFDAVYQRFDRLETEYQMIVAGLRRVEERLDALAEAQQKLALRSDLQQLKARVDALQEQIREIEGRLGE